VASGGDVAEEASRDTAGTPGVDEVDLPWEGVEVSFISGATIGSEEGVKAIAPEELAFDAASFFARISSRCLRISLNSLTADLKKPKPVGE